ncbi:hypothetical protein IP91_00100 [Pseudoduganella lurida]|uniref:Uncharacterized protein n=1 Tax=Pseudoduganella lurida TaxID=1036180 RepID=A0A562RIY5_9BURK|nr:hypothetical protein [Pseudoduganella lurida]TWI69035.1 hypothetical protein IP91_00100 [Pseudoduganella lurida]
MKNLPPDHPAATKVIAKACTWVDRRKAAQCAPVEEKARAAGKLKVSGNELAEAVEKYRRAGEGC